MSSKSTAAHRWRRADLRRVNSSWKAQIPTQYRANKRSQTYLSRLPRTCLNLGAFTHGPGIYIIFSTQVGLLATTLYFVKSPNAREYEQICFAGCLVIHGSHDSRMLLCPLCSPVPNFFPPIGPGMYIELSCTAVQSTEEYQPRRYNGKDFICGGGPDDGKAYPRDAWTVMLLAMSLHGRPRCEHDTLEHR